jgi:hypothetical protein
MSDAEQLLKAVTHRCADHPDQTFLYALCRKQQGTLLLYLHCDGQTGAFQSGIVVPDEQLKCFVTDRVGPHFRQPRTVDKMLLVATDEVYVMRTLSSMLALGYNMFEIGALSPSPIVRDTLGDEQKD